MQKGAARPAPGLQKQSPQSRHGIFALPKAEQCFASGNVQNGGKAPRPKATCPRAAPRLLLAGSGHR